MPQLQTFIVAEIPERFRGVTFPPPTSDTLRPTCDAAEIPALAAEGITGPIRIVSISNAGTRSYPDGRPMVYRVELACVETDGALPRGGRG